MRPSSREAIALAFLVLTAMACAYFKTSKGGSGDRPENLPVECARATALKQRDPDPAGRAGGASSALLAAPPLAIESTTVSPVVHDAVDLFREERSVREAAEYPETQALEDISISVLAPGTPSAILSVEVNGEALGDLFVRLAQDGRDVYLEQADFEHLGLTEPGKLVEVDGALLVSLASLRPRLEFEIDERDLALRIVARPELLGFHEFGGCRRPEDAEYVEGGSAFLNYDLDFYRRPGSSSMETLLTHEVGFRLGRILALSSFAWQRSAEASDYRRLQTQVIVDYPASLRRMAVLDTVGSSGPLGSALPMGGVTLAKNYSLDPYFVWFPTPQFAGSVMTASDIEIYQNGFLTHRLHVPPGQFHIDDLHVAAIGAGSYDVVIRDAFGRETSLSQPFYLSKDLLRRGLHAYNYGLGFMRDYSYSGDPEYGDAALLVDHRYGVLDRVTAGYNLEVSESVRMAGVSADIGLGRAGILRIGTAMGEDESGRGGAGFLGYSFFGSRFSANLHLRSFSESYANLARVQQAAPVEFDGMLRLSIRPLRFTSLSASWSRTDTADGMAYTRAGLTWNRRLTRMAHLSATYERQTRRLADARNVNDNRIFAGLHIYLPSRVSLDVSHSGDDHGSRQVVTVGKNVPMQLGYGYRASVERASFDGEDDELRPDLMAAVNAPFGTYSAEYSELAGDASWRVGMAGSLALVEGSLYASRPLSQSFAVVRTANVEGVRVEYNGQTVGRTRRGGEILVPNLRPYEVNRLSIIEEDLPLDYSAARFERSIVPVPRSGAVVDFGLARVRAIFGRLMTREGEERRPLEHLALSIDGVRPDISWRSGLDGEFYLENVPQGRHEMIGVVGNRRFVCPLVVPSSDESFLDLGEVLCEPLR
jgi:outer membrane usher protein